MSVLKDLQVTTHSVSYYLSLWYLKYILIGEVCEKVVDISEIPSTCALNCLSQGKCVRGKCVCNQGYGGEDCSKTCER